LQRLIKEGCKMRLIDNWWAVLLRSWAGWAGILAAILNGVSITVYFITASMPVPPIWLAVANGLLGIAVPLLRLIPQKSISGDPDADQ
jgi:hypothetical protein